MTQAASFHISANDNAARAPRREWPAWNWRLLLALAGDVAAWAALAALVAAQLKGCF